MSFQPLKNRVLVKRDAPITEVGGILIAEAAQKPELFGTIVALGDKADDSLKIGDRVVFGKVDGIKIKNEYVGEDGDFLLMEDTQIKGTVIND